jgi:DNA recombination protein RmuC
LDSSIAVVALLIGLAVGAIAAAWFLRRTNRLTLDAALASAGAEDRARLASALATIAARDDESAGLKARLEAAIAEARASTVALGHAQSAEARLDAQLAEERERAGEKIAAILAARDELSAHFRALAGEALETNRKRMAEQHEGALDQILKPLGEKLVAFEKKVEETYDREAQQRSSLRQEVLNLQAATLRINEDAKNLTQALKGESKTRGNWGEVVLERVLERSGLVKGVEYHTQHTMHDDEGAVSRPDVVILLPDNKHVIIDSKVSLVAYDRYYAAADEAARTVAGREHVEGMRRHIKSLREKNYQGGKHVDSPDFVVMFVPIEPAFGLASSIAPELFLEAWDRKVVIVTPSNLLAMLMTVRTLWQRDKQTRNAIEIAAHAGRMHDEFARLIEALGKLGDKLRDAQNAFHEIEHRLVSGPRNLVGKVDKLREMGARTRKQLPPDLLLRADEEGERSTAPQQPASKLSLVTPPNTDVEPR